MPSFRNKLGDTLIKLGNKTSGEPLRSPSAVALFLNHGLERYKFDSIPAESATEFTARTHRPYTVDNITEDARTRMNTVINFSVSDGTKMPVTLLEQKTVQTLALEDIQAEHIRITLRDGFVKAFTVMLASDIKNYNTSMDLSTDMFSLTRLATELNKLEKILNAPAPSRKR